MMSSEDQPGLLLHARTSQSHELKLLLSQHADLIDTNTEVKKEKDELNEMRDKLRLAKLQLRKWRQMDERVKEEHRFLSDKDILRGQKLKVAIVQKERAIYKHIDIIRFQQKLLVNLILKAVRQQDRSKELEEMEKEFEKQEEEKQTAAAEVKPTITFDPQAVQNIYKRYLEKEEKSAKSDKDNAKQQLE